MKLHVLAVGDRVPRWVDEACADYLQRFPPHCPLRVETVPTPRRGKNPDIGRLRDKEYRALSALIPRAACIIALDEKGRSMSTERLAERLAQWMQHETDVVFLIGGPDGHAPGVLDSVRETWSLSAFTLPHQLARVLIVEQLYRAVSILNDHPYHRSG